MLIIQPKKCSCSDKPRYIHFLLHRSQMSVACYGFPHYSTRCNDLQIQAIKNSSGHLQLVQRSVPTPNQSCSMVFPHPHVFKKASEIRHRSRDFFSSILVLHAHPRLLGAPIPETHTETRSFRLNQHDCIEKYRHPSECFVAKLRTKPRRRFRVSQYRQQYRAPDWGMPLDHCNHSFESTASNRVMQTNLPERKARKRRSYVAMSSCSSLSGSAHRTNFGASAPGCISKEQGSCLKYVSHHYPNTSESIMCHRFLLSF